MKQELKRLLRCSPETTSRSKWIHESQKRLPLHLLWVCSSSSGCPSACAMPLATFQRLMQRCLGGQVNDFLLIDLDDVIVYSPCFDSHLGHLEQVFERLHQYGLKLQPQKCHLFHKEVKYLGHIVSKRGVAIDPDKTVVVQNWLVPTTVTQVRSFLNFAGYYHHFIPRFSRVAAPSMLFPRGPLELRGQPFSGPQSVSRRSRSSSRHYYRAQCWRMQTLASRSCCIAMPVLKGWGQCFLRCKGGRERVIAYASHSLKPHERNGQYYSSFNLKLLAHRACGRTITSWSSK